MTAAAIPAPEEETSHGSTVALASVFEAQVKPSAQLQEPASASASASQVRMRMGRRRLRAKGSYVHRCIGADGRKYVIVNRDAKEPNAEERLNEEQKLAKAQKDLDEMKLNHSQMNDQITTCRGSSQA